MKQQKKKMKQILISYGEIRDLFRHKYGEILEDIESGHEKILSQTENAVK